MVDAPIDGLLRRGKENAAVSSRRAYPLEEVSQTQEACEPSSGAGLIVFISGMSVPTGPFTNQGVFRLEAGGKDPAVLLDQGAVERRQRELI